jgi:hypothetical protein
VLQASKVLVHAYYSAKQQHKMPQLWEIIKMQYAVVTKQMHHSYKVATYVCVAP